MRTRLKCALLALVAIPAWPIDPGEGSLTDAIRVSIQNAFQRGSFRFRHTVKDTVKAYGGTGFFQTFNDTQRTGGTAAIVWGGSAPGDTAIQAFQVYSSLFAHYGTVGTTAAGFPVMDSDFFQRSGVIGGEWAKFQKNYALFAWYSVPDTSNPATAFTVKDSYYTRWSELGEMSGPGAATSAEAAITSPRGLSATVQRFQNASLHNFTAGVYSGRMFAVVEPVLSSWRANQAEAGYLGHPISDETRLPDGRRQQAFEGGTIVYRTGEAPQVLPRVTKVTIRSLTPLRLSAGETVTLRAEMEIVLGGIVSDRPVSWLSSSQRVATVASSGTNSAVVTGVGSGSATITAISESVTSTPITILVTGVCCAVGEGAPAVTSSAMEAALIRNGVTVRRPLTSPARRSGGAWLQEALSADGRIRYLLVKPDSSANAFVLTGDILAVWETLSAAIGFPSGDLTPGGRQQFERGTLAGRPVQLVSGSILNRWSVAGFETGALGDPSQPAATFLSFAATPGTVQNFRSGVVVDARSRALAVSGRIATEYRRLGGPEGQLGVPLGEELLDGGRRRQSFEGGVLSYTDAEPAVALEAIARRPQVAVSPAVASPGGRVSIAVGGFENGARVNVSFQPSTASPPFVVTLPTGAFGWEVLIPANARAETIAVVAEDAGRPGVSARGSYSVRQPVGTRLTVTGGDGQSGVPGAVLPLALTLRALSTDGVPLIAQPVRWEASPGAQVVNADRLTNETGDARAFLRLPANEGIAIVTAAVGGQVVAFSARVGGRSLPNFPRLSQAIDGTLGTTSATIRERGSQVAALASMIRYRQLNGALPQPQGLADVARLNDFLRTFCVPDSGSGTICDGYLLAGENDPYVNLWRLAAFVDGGVDVVSEPATDARLRELAGADEPALLALSLTAFGQPAGTHFVVLTGVGADGSLQIHDPNPAFARTTLDAYLNGFSDIPGRPIRASLAAVIRLVLRPAVPGGFLAAGAGSFRVLSSGGNCPVQVAWPGQASTFRMTWCDGTQASYQLDVEPGSSASLTSLDSPGERSALPASPSVASYRVFRPAAVWRVQPQDLAFSAEAVINGATFRPGLAPGAFFTVFGSGLANATVEIGGLPAQVVFSSPFQLNGVVPAAAPPGSLPVRIRSNLGDVIQQVVISRNSPGVFLLGDGGAAVTNQDGMLNRPSSPERRGRAIILYMTGLGATERRGNLDWSADPVRVSLGGRDLAPLFAGLTPGFVGLYQVNVLIPNDLPPGLRLPLRVFQGASEANPVEVAVQ